MQLGPGTPLGVPMVPGPWLRYFLEASHLLLCVTTGLITTCNSSLQLLACSASVGFWIRRLRIQISPLPHPGPVTSGFPSLQ